MGMGFPGQEALPTSNDAGLKPHEAQGKICRLSWRKEQRADPVDLKVEAVGIDSVDAMVDRVLMVDICFTRTGHEHRIKHAWSIGFKCVVRPPGPRDNYQLIARLNNHKGPNNSRWQQTVWAATGSSLKE